MREPTTYDTITGPGTSRESSARCYRSRPAGGSGATSPVRWPLTPNTWYITGGNRTGQTHHVDRARWASEFRSMSCCSCQVHLRRAHVIPSRLARRASSFGPRVNRVQDTAAPGARSVRCPPGARMTTAARRMPAWCPDGRTCRAVRDARPRGARMAGPGGPVLGLDAGPCAGRRRPKRSRCRAAVGGPAIWPRATRRGGGCRQAR